MIRQRLSRRDFLRASAAGAVGLAGAQLLGCGDGGEPVVQPTATASPAPTATSETATGVLAWRQIIPTGDVPSARRDHSLVTDGERLYLFGGRGQDVVGDIWVYDIAQNAWRLPGRQLSGQAFSRPPNRFGHNSVWSTRRRMVLFGGQADSGEFFNDTWLFDPADETWVELPDLRTPPSQRYGAAAALDPSGRMIVTHGFTNEGRFDDTWEFALLDNFWAEISPEGARPIERCLMRAVWDAARERLIIFGGQTNATPFLGDTWREEPAEGRPPSPRAGHDAAFAAGALYVFGGSDGSSELSDLWVLSAA